MNVVKRLGMKKYKTLNVFGKFPVVHLSGIQKEKASGFYIVFYKIDFVDSASMSEKYSQIEVVLVWFQDVFMTCNKMIFNCICVKISLFFIGFELLNV